MMRMGEKPEKSQGPEAEMARIGRKENRIKEKIKPEENQKQAETTTKMICIIFVFSLILNF